MTPLTFVTFRWQPPSGYRSNFAPETVQVLRKMIARHYHQPHRFVCITDDTKGLKGIETFPLWPDHGWVVNPSGSHNPSCYRRLKLFAPEAKGWFGERLVCMDLDTVIVGDITPLFQADVDFKIWGCSDYKSQWFNGSLWMLKTGSHPEVWQTFDPRTSPRAARKAGCFGSDQAWMRYVLGNKQPVWDESDGVYSYRKHIAINGNVLPANARIVCFHGKIDPWNYAVAQVPWIKEHYYADLAVAS